MGKSSRKHKEARKFREEQELSKSDWEEGVRLEKMKVYYDVPVIRYKWKINNKYPK